MKNGLLILVAIGIGFIFFATDFMKSVEGDPSSADYTVTPEEETIYKYFKDGASGNKIFDPAPLTIEKAKEFWDESKIKQEMMDYFPKFDLMKKYVKLHVATGDFLELVLSKISEAELKYQTGKINYEEARRIIDNL
jgi:hypothetical protein